MTFLLVIYLFLPGGAYVKDVQTLHNVTAEQCLLVAPAREQEMRKDHPDATSAIAMCIAKAGPDAGA